MSVSGAAPVPTSGSHRPTDDRQPKAQIDGKLTTDVSALSSGAGNVFQTAAGNGATVTLIMPAKHPDARARR